MFSFSALDQNALSSRNRDILGYSFFQLMKAVDFLSLSSFSHFVVYCTKNRRLSYFVHSFKLFWIIVPNMS